MEDPCINESIKEEKCKKWLNKRTKSDLFKTFVTDFDKWWFSEIEKYQIIGLKKTWETTKRINGENSYTTVTQLENWNYRFEIDQYDNTIIFEWKDINSLQQKYNKRYDKKLTYREYVAPDGTIWTYAFFVKELKKWISHGCKIIIKPSKKSKHRKK